MKTIFRIAIIIIISIFTAQNVKPACVSLVQIAYRWDSEQFFGPTNLEVSSWPNYEARGTYIVSGKWKKYEDGIFANVEYCLDVDNVDIWAANSSDTIDDSKKTTIVWELKAKLGGWTPSSDKVSSLRNEWHVFNSPDDKKELKEVVDQMNKTVTFAPR